ncbi:MAG: aminotransferase class I/II-fold pyridoxal phosphate-dependent enzyme [Clostridiales bacterium]|nr:aminotransferase class I/II-fold pyridoxal phosphate-dependent enzyme [Clostridiales bacterium]
MIFIDRQGEAAAAINDALGGTDYVKRLERDLSAATGKNVVAVSTFDSGVHTALHLCGVGSGDYVFVPTFTFYSYLAPVTNMGAVPVFLDCDPETRCVSPLALETALVWASLQNKPPKAVIIDNAFGSVADYDKLIPMCKAWNVPTVELCAHVLCGGRYDGDYVVIGFGSEGGGGAVACGDDSTAARQFARYEYTDGENHDYRLNNYSAALACAYLSVLPKIHERNRANLSALISSLDCVMPPVKGDAAFFALCKTDKAKAIEAAGFAVMRPPLAHTLSKYAGCHYFEHEQGYSVCASLCSHALISMDFSPFRRLRLITMLK